MSTDLQTADYVVLSLLLVVSTLIGVYYAWTNRRRGNSREFLTGGRTLTALPVSMSLTSSFMSSNTLLVNPSEVYSFGTIFGVLVVSYFLAILITSELYLPFFYRLALTSTYEYLELRFNRAIRLLGTVLFMVQTVLFTGIIIYGPALAISQVTGINLWAGVLLTGFVCILYCTLGGLKAVVWTDVFQLVIMLAGFVSVTIMCANLQGGLDNILTDAEQGGRLNTWDFDVNPLRRHTFWTIAVGGTFGWTSIYGINQGQVQRYVSCKSLAHARAALYINFFGLCSFLVCSVFAGLCLYSVYKDCDPLTAGYITTNDQLVPYLVVNTLTATPGIPGLFFAAVYSSSLSTVSSSINALAAVTVEDLIKPFTQLSEGQLTWVSRAMTFLFGALCIAVAGLASVMGGMMQASVTITSVFGGPLLGIFSLGICCPFANSKGVLSGLISGLAVGVGVCLMWLISPPSRDMTRPLPLSTDGCNFTSTDFNFNWTSAAMPTHASTVTTNPGPITDDKHLEPLSYLYFSLVAMVTSVLVGILASLATGGSLLKVEPKLLFQKEDTTAYQAFMFFKKRAKRRHGKLDLPTTGMEKSGKINSAFYDMEMDK